jgi:DNA-directed RNA polymerase specialized sigma24 family protein
VIYVRGSSYRSLGDPVDLVQGFFENRLSRDDYLDKWLVSGLPLRVWLIKGLKFYLLETTRRGPNDRVGAMAEEPPGDDGEGPAAEFRREVARGMVREALRVVSEELEAEGLGEHWRVFTLHHLEGLGYASVGERVGVTEERAMVMGRTATRRLRKRLRQMCSWPGASDEEIDGELVSMFD